jgi:hypothetical protein
MVWFWCFAVAAGRPAEYVSSFQMFRCCRNIHVHVCNCMYGTPLSWRLAGKCLEGNVGTTISISTPRTKHTNGGEEGGLAVGMRQQPGSPSAPDVNFTYVRSVPPLKIKICFNVVLDWLLRLSVARRRAAGTRDKQQQPGGLNRRPDPVPFTIRYYPN